MPTELSAKADQQGLINRLAENSQTIEQQQAEIAALRAQLEARILHEQVITLPNGDLYRVAPAEERPDNIQLSPADKARSAMLEKMLEGGIPGQDPMQMAAMQFAASQGVQQALTPDARSTAADLMADAEAGLQE